MDYFEMYKDTWNFHKKYIDHLEDSDEFWRMLIDEGREISRKYGQCKFIVNLILNEICELERVFKAKFERREKTA